MSLIDWMVPARARQGEHLFATHACSLGSGNETGSRVRSDASRRRYARSVVGSVPSEHNSGAGPRTARLLALAIATSLIIVLALAALALRRGDGVSALMVPGRTGPSVAVFHRDFPGAGLVVGDGHDGQQFYAIVRQPMHLRALVPDLDRPRYRLQRILEPALAWALEPQGGGPGLAVAVFAVAALGAVLVGFGGALVLDVLGAPVTTVERAALLLPVAPGVIASIGIATPDALAFGLALVAIALDLRGHIRWAVVAAVLAVLAKESMLLVLAGWMVWRGMRALWMVTVPAVAAAGWWLALRLALPGTPDASHEFRPVDGLIQSARHWLHTSSDVLAAVAVCGALALGAAVLAVEGAAHAARTGRGPATRVHALPLPRRARPAVERPPRRPAADGARGHCVVDPGPAAVTRARVRCEAGAGCERRARRSAEPRGSPARPRSGSPS